MYNFMLKNTNIACDTDKSVQEKKKVVSKRTIVVAIFLFLVVGSIIVSQINKQNVINDSFDEASSIIEGIESDSGCVVEINVEVFERLVTGEIHVAGWSFCETQNDNKQKSVNLLLENQATGQNFHVSAVLLERPDVYEHFKDSKQIHGTLHGFSVVFQADELPEGTYELQLQCRENDSESGSVSLNKQILITENDISLNG